MSKIICILLPIIIFSGCGDNEKTENRVPVAKVGEVILYYDEIPQLLQTETSKNDSLGIIQNYINKWAKKELVLSESGRKSFSGIKK